MTQSRALSNQQVARAALVVLTGFFASGVLGFLRTAVISAQFGTGEALDAFYAAQRIPELIFNLVAGGALGSSFIPIYARLRDQDERQAWELASAVMTLASLAAALLGIIVTLFADPLVTHVLLSDSSPAAQALTANMIRMMMITPFIFSISGLVMGILQSHGLFLLPSVAISMNSIGIMFGALVIAPLLAQPVSALDMVLSVQPRAMPVLPTLPVEQIGNANVYGLAIGAVLSAVLHLAVQIPGLVQVKVSLRVLANWRIEGVMAVLRLMGPRVLGMAVVQINFVVNIILADGMAEGSLTALITAFNLMFFALGIIGQSVGSAVFPTLAALAAEKDFDGFKNRLSNAMRSVLFLSLPATVLFIVLGEPLVSIFERGVWTAESTAATAWALAFYAIGICGFTLLEVLSRAFYALADTWTPVIVGVAAMVANIILSIVLIQYIGESGSLMRGPFAGLALANASTTLVEALALWWLMRRKIGTQGTTGGINDSYILDGVWRTAAASVLMGSVLIALQNILPLQGFSVAIIGGIVGGIVFFSSSVLLGLQEAKAVPLMIWRRIRR